MGIQMNMPVGFPQVPSPGETALCDQDRMCTMRAVRSERQILGQSRSHRLSRKRCHMLQRVMQSSRRFHVLLTPLPKFKGFQSQSLMQDKIESKPFVSNLRK